MPPLDPLMRSQLIRPALHAVRAAGGDPQLLLREFKLPADALTDVETVISLSLMEPFFDRAAQLAADPWLGLHLARLLERGTFGLAEFAARSAPTVGAGLERLVRYIGLLNELVTVEVHRQARLVSVEQRIAGKPSCLGRHANEFFVGFMVHQLRELTGAEQAPRRVWFAHRAPPRQDELARALGANRLEFDRGANGFEIDAALLAKPLATAEPVLLGLLDDQAAQQLSLRASPIRFLGQVRAIVHQSLPDGAPAIASVAKAMSLSSRSLQRRLGDEGTTFKQLVESVREEMARAYVARGTQPMGEIAFLLGFSESSAFVRAFKRWTGMTAREFRALEGVTNRTARG